MDTPAIALFAYASSSTACLVNVTGQASEAMVLAAEAADSSGKLIVRTLLPPGELLILGCCTGSTLCTVGMYASSSVACLVIMCTLLPPGGVLYTTALTAALSEALVAALDSHLAWFAYASSSTACLVIVRTLMQPGELLYTSALIAALHDAPIAALDPHLARVAYASSSTACLVNVTAGTSCRQRAASWLLAAQSTCRAYVLDFGTSTVAPI
jgi:hypothetical protein